MGDLLLTGGNRRRLQYLPLLGRISSLPKSVRQLPLSSIAQKVAMLSPTVAVAWSGSFVVARRTLTDLRDFVLDRRAISGVDLLSCLDNLDYGDWKHLSLIGLVARQEEVSDLFFHNANHKKHEAYGDVLAGGSGSGFLFSSMATLDFKRELSRFSLLVAGAKALVEELFTVYPLKMGFGGAYEFAFPKHGVITKIDNLLYIFWVVGDYDRLRECGDTGILRLASGPLILKQFYVDDVAIILRASLSKNVYAGAPRPYGRGELNLCIAAPPFADRSSSSITFDDERVNQRGLVSSIFALRRDDKWEFLLHVDTPREDELSVQFDLKKRRSTLSWSKAYWERVMEEAGRRIREHAE